MIGVMMIVRTKPGRAREFARLTAKLQRDVRANEPGALIWQVMRADDDPDLFYFTELFATAEAHAAHPGMPYHVAMSAAGWDCVEGEPEIRLCTPLTDRDIEGESE
ncbi:antibiotic biosynthesis monooxygenase [Sphingomonas histidinilytica]|jgi:quinol monooxygenase YgiN|uniref:Quinol monooxygenase YgiN n=1 Tax=Rhizorhabdus histidinilytica TaxID=439228 RepID=A0A1T5H101_9SPHN|nr:antibiotic biosynthesis monooxygenase [Rhizorhabdus histidinilytica]MBO9375834.1 antibiotic biosynthesis monooxygenase [Rhizorhabdus histidinilytica]QEH81345.1 antibiotic biosynthesis monooxygenase [Sphingomonas sp. C8-2]SKC14269.1 Quinol monooxygenase YgiN [Rhizorhabdus histidinilytica]